MNLGVILNYRTQIEEALRTELVQMQGVLHEAEAIVRDMEQAAERETTRYLSDTEQGLSAEEIAGRQSELEALADRIRRAQGLVEQHRRRCGDKLAEVLAASQERRKLELVEERQERRELAESNRLEQKALDEMAGRRYLAERRGRSTEEETQTDHGE